MTGKQYFKYLTDKGLFFKHNQGKKTWKWFSFKIYHQSLTSILTITQTWKLLVMRDLLPQTKRLIKFLSKKNKKFIFI